MSRLKIILPKAFTFSTEVKVRVTDVNYAGHLANDRVLSLVHEARLRFLQNFGFSEMDVAGTGTIMTEAVVIYKSQAFQGDSLVIEVAAGDPHERGCNFYYRLSNQATGREVARARTGCVFFDYQSKKMAPMPEQFREKVPLVDGGVQ